MKFILLFFLANASFLVFSQKSALTILPLFGEEKLTLNKKYVIGDDWIEFTSFRFYLGNISCYSDEKEMKDSTALHLIDLEYPESMQINGMPSIVDSIYFELGIDSATNVSGRLDGVLDPILGMYWAWNSGYINFKIEGHSSSVKNADQLFEFHIGGYLSPYETIQRIQLRNALKTSNQCVALDIKSFLSELDLSHIPNIMTPGKAAHDAAKILPALFFLQTIDE